MSWTHVACLLIAQLYSFDVAEPPNKLRLIGIRDGSATLVLHPLSSSLQLIMFLCVHFSSLHNVWLSLSLSPSHISTTISPSLFLPILLQNVLKIIMWYIATQQDQWNGYLWDMTPWLSTSPWCFTVKATTSWTLTVTNKSEVALVHCIIVPANNLYSWFIKMKTLSLIDLTTKSLLGTQWILFNRQNLTRLSISYQLLPWIKFRTLKNRFIACEMVYFPLKS